MSRVLYQRIRSWTRTRPSMMNRNALLNRDIIVQRNILYVVGRGEMEVQDKKAKDARML